MTGGDFRMTEQELLNESFDWLLSFLGVSLWGYDDTPGATGGRRIAVDTEGKLEVSAADPLADYKDANIDVTGDPLYIGYLKADGNWYIKQISVSAGTVLYFKGSIGYDSSWTNRGGLDYDAYNAIF